jgi:putative oxidoreductase
MQQPPPSLSLAPGGPTPARASRTIQRRFTAVSSLLRTEAHFAPAIARVVLGAAILPHGAQKLFGWFGGYGFTGTMNWFTQTMHMPWLLGFAAILAETLGGFALIAGFATRIAALALGVIFVTAVALLHGQHGFFQNWFGNQKGEGYEYFVLGLALVAIAVIYGGGAASVDRLLTRGRRP